MGYEPHLNTKKNHRPRRTVRKRVPLWAEIRCFHGCLGGGGGEWGGKKKENLSKSANPVDVPEKTFKRGLG